MMKYYEYYEIFYDEKIYSFICINNKHTINVISNN